MIAVGMFRHSFELERALSGLERSGIPSHQILVVFMDRAPQGPPRQKQPGELQTNSVEVGMACATGLSVIGASVGFILPWGPVLCGLASAFAGFGIGSGLYRFIRRKDGHPSPTGALPELTVIVQCREDQYSRVQDIMWSHQALTVGCTEPAPP